jgi:hypothetical protein
LREIAFVVAVAMATACGPDHRRDSAAIDAPDEPCVGIQCQIVNCARKGLPDTTLSGTVFAPNGTLALYGVQVYVPLLAPGPLPDGVSCQRCESANDPAAARSVSAPDGTFTLKNAPAGSEVPLVIQIGKWRRSVLIPHVEPCTDNPLPATLTSLPKQKSEGDIPHIAISTGGCDALECLVRKLGVVDAEFTAPSGDGAIHLYANGGAARLANTASFPNSADLWGNLETLKRYDIVLNSCECSQNAANKTQQMMDNMKTFADLGGRLFLSHYHNVWIEGERNTLKRPQVWPDIAVCDQVDTVPGGTLAVIDQQQPKGPAFAMWMKAVGGASGGALVITDARQTCSSIDSTKAERWLYIQVSSELQTFQFTTPNEAPKEERCGRVVFSDMHVSGGSTSSPNTPFPQGCNMGPLSKQEKALAFMLFDISSCLGDVL